MVKKSLPDRWIEIDCPVCGMDYDINDPTDAQWEHPVCEVCGSQPYSFERFDNDHVAQR